MKFIGYVRVSDKEQVKKGFSIEAQQESIQAWCDEQQHHLVKIFVEPGRSGSKPSKIARPTFESAVNYVLIGGAEGLVVRWMDRFARNVEDFLRVRSQFYQGGKHLVSISEPLLNGDPGDPISRFISVSIMNAYQLQAELSGLKATQGRQRRAKAGHYPGTPPIGYLRRDKKVIVDPHQGQLIATAFREYSTGRYTLDSWGKEAETRGYKNNRGKVMNKGAWHRIFRSAFYIGRYTWKGETYSGDYEALIDKETFEMVQGLLDSHGPGPGQQRHSWLLAGLLWSDVHRKVMTGALIKGKFKYYRAAGRPEHNVPADGLEERVVNLLTKTTWTGENRYNIPDHWRLALSASENVGQVYEHLNEREQKELLRVVFFKKGIRIASGGAIIGIDVLPGFKVDVRL